MHSLTMLTLVLCILALGQIALGQSPLVTTSQGTMKGKVLKSRDGREFFSFTKIPYAKPPLGDRRFKIPEKAGNWTGILDAREKIPECFQPVVFKAGTVGQEDCLYLNVFTPNITGKLPVIFSIHGGAFKMGSAGDFGSARYYMDEDVVFVAPNYRLGSIGFLSLEDNVISGNMGLKDQALALEWVKKDIAVFGGDPDLITVIGESAGGVSSDLICAAPRTNGLIKGCVSQSGNGWTNWAILKPGLARQMALNMAKAIGCGENGLLKCLQEKPIEVVGNTTLLEEGNRGLSLVSPVLEPVTAPEPLLISWPTSAKHSYPWIVGVCQDDGMVYTMFYESHLASQEAIEKFINSFNQTLLYELDLEKRTNDLVRIRERFFKEGVDPLIAMRNFATEFEFLYPSLKGLSRHSGPTYFYKFNYTRGPPLPLGIHNISGVPHAAELPFFFETNQNPDWAKPEDITLSKMLVKMWVNFARDQTPSSHGTMQWPQFQGQYFLDIQDTGVRISNFSRYQEILDFWKTIIPNQSSKSSMNDSSMLLIALLSIFAAYKVLL